MSKSEMKYFMALGYTFKSMCFSRNPKAFSELIITETFALG